MSNNLSNIAAFNSKLDEWKLTESFVKTQVFSRLGNLTLAPSTLAFGAVDTALGAVAACASILTLGKFKPTYVFAKQHLESSRFLISGPFACFVKTFNPEADFDFEGTGVFSELAKEVLADRGKEFSKKDSFVKREIVSRLTYTVYAVAIVVARVADLVIGLISALISVLTLGNYEKPNELAYTGLQVTGIVKDLLFCVIKIINPHACKRN